MRIATTLLALCGAFGVAGAQDPERYPNNDETQRFPWWTEPASLGGPGAKITDPVIAVNSQNVLTTAWAEDGKIFVSDNIWKDRNANGWTEPFEVPSTGPGMGIGAAAPDIVYDSDDKLHVVFQEFAEVTQPDGDDYCKVDILYATRSRDGKWAPAIPITNSYGEEVEGQPNPYQPAEYKVWIYLLPQIASIGTTVHITYIERFMVRDGDNNDREFRQVWYTNGGAAQVIPGAGGPVGEPDFSWPELSPARISIADEGGTEVPHVAWRDNIKEDGQCQRGFYVHHTAKFPTTGWSAKEKVPTDCPQTIDFDIYASAPDARAHVVFQPEASGNFPKIKYRVREMGSGGSFGGVEEVGDADEPDGLNTLPRILVDSRNQAHVLWNYAGPEGESLAYARKVKDTTWKYQQPIEIVKKVESTLEVAINKNDGMSLVTGHLPPMYNCQVDQKKDESGEPQGSYYTAPRPPYEFRFTATSTSPFIGGGAAWFVQSYEPNVGNQDGSVQFPTAPGTSINVATGGTVHSLPLFTTQGAGLSVSISLIHNSLRWDPGVISPGWTHSYHIYLTDHKIGTGSEPDDRITLSLGDGSRVVLAWNDEHKGFIADPEFGYFAKIERKMKSREDGSPEWALLLTTKFGIQYAFNDKGKLERIIGTNKNNVMTLKYEDGLLKEIIDTMMRSTKFEYDEENDDRLKKVTDPDEKTYEILYYGPNPPKRHVKSVQFMNSPKMSKWQYDYYTNNDSQMDERINLMSKITTPRGFDWELKYEQDNRLFSSKDPKLSFKSVDESGTASIDQHDPIEFKYTDPEDPTKDTLPDVEVKDRRSNRTTVMVEYKRSLAREIKDAKSKTIKREYDGEYRNLTKITDREGNEAKISYESGSLPAWVKDNVQKVEEPSADALSGQGKLVPTAQYTYETSSCQYSRVNSYRDALNNKTTYTIDENGNVTEIIHPTSGQGGPCKDVFKIETDGHGRAETHTDAMKKVTTYEFDGTTGLVSRIHRPGRSRPSMAMYDAMGNVDQNIRPTGGITKTDYDGLDLPCKVTLPDGDESAAVSYEYDEDGNLTSISGPGAASTTNVYDKLGRLVSTSAPMGNNRGTSSIQYFYDPEGNLRKTVASPDVTTLYEVDELGRVTKQTVLSRENPDVTVDYVPSANGWVTETKSGARTIKTPRTTRGAVKTSSPQGVGVTGIKAEHSYYDDGIHGKTVLTDGGRFVAGTLRTFDRLRLLSSTRILDESTAGLELPGPGDTIAEGTRVKRDCNGRMTQVTDPDGRTVTTVLDDGGRPVAVKDSNGRTVATRTWTDNDRPATESVAHPETNALIVTRRNTYNKRDELTSAVDAAGNEGRFTYDAQGNVKAVSFPMGGLVRYEYDAHGNVVTEIRQPGNAGAQVWKRQYSSSGNVTTIIDPKNNTYTMEYDAADRMIRYSSPLPGGGKAIESWTYNEHGEMATAVDRAGKITTYSYDGLGRLTTESHSVGKTEIARIVRGYDAASRPVAVHDEISKVKISYTTDGGGSGYDDRGNLRQMNVYLENTVLWKKIRYTDYDQAGNLKAKEVMIGRDGGAVPVNDSYSYIYDSNGRLVVLSRIGGLSGKMVEALIRYSTAGARQEMTLLSNSTEVLRHEYDYDELGRMARVFSVKPSDGTVVSSFEYAYDARNRPINAVLAHLDTQVTWSYDAFDRLTSESWVGNANPTSPVCAYLVTPEVQDVGNKNDLAALLPPSQPVAGQVAPPGTAPTVENYTALWEYDTLGNRTHELEQYSQGGSMFSWETDYTYTNQSALRLESETRTKRDEPGGIIDTMTVDYTYTRNGSLSTRTTDGSVVEQWFYNYREVAGAYLKGAGASEAWVYLSDPLGNRIAKKNLLNQQEDWFLVEGGSVLAEYRRTSGSSFETLKHTYVSGLGIDSKLARIDANETAESAFFYTGDKMGTVHQLVDESGNEHQRQLSNAWGEDLPGFQSLIPSAPDAHGLHQRRKDAESDLMYFRNRHYDPAIGRFTQTDPIRGNRPWEHYVYAFNNPLQFTDPLGLQGQEGKYRNPDTKRFMYLTDNKEDEEQFWNLVVQARLGKTVPEFVSKNWTWNQRKAWAYEEDNQWKWRSWSTGSLEYMKWRVEVAALNEMDFLEDVKRIERMNREERKKHIAKLLSGAHEDRKIYLGLLLAEFAPGMGVIEAIEGKDLHGNSLESSDRVLGAIADIPAAKLVKVLAIIGSAAAAVVTTTKVIERTGDAADFAISLNKGRHGIVAALDGKGIMSLVVEAGKDSPMRGREMFGRAVAHYGDKLNGIRGFWTYGDNLAEVNRLTGAGVSLEEAVTRTWTAKMSREHGFNAVRIVGDPQGTAGAYTKIEVIFGR